jgi:GGDEF domain-containing protein
MDHPTTAHVSDGDQGTITREEFDQRLGHLAEKWRTHRGADLEIRHETGKLLNDHFGPPDTRQKRGEGVLKEAAERLRTTESELSRMRRFASSFESFADLMEKYPDATTWTAVKGLLPKLKPQGGRQTGGSGNGTASSGGRKQARPVQFGRVKQALANLSSKLRKAREVLSEDEKKELRQQFQELAKAISDCLQIPVSVGQVSAETAPPAAPAE